MDFGTFKELLVSDLYRYNGFSGWRVFVRALLLGIGSRYSIWMRLEQWLDTNSRIWNRPARLIVKILRRRAMLRFGISITGSSCGPGLYIGHFGNIVVSSQAKIGRNCNISQGVTIGVTRGGKRPGFPTIGDNVYIGSGAKVIGDIHVGDNVAIGANAVVTRDIPDNAVAVGIPAEVISYKGSRDYIHNADYD